MSANIWKVVSEGDLSAIQRLVTQDSNILKQKDENGRFPIHWAASNANEEIVDYLLKHNSVYNSPDDSGWTPLIIASSAGRPKTVEMLIAKGADVHSKTDTGHSALQYSCSRDRPEVISFSKYVMIILNYVIKLFLSHRILFQSDC